MMPDRAARVAETLVAELVEVMVTVAGNELKRRIIEALRDEFADERQQGVANRELPDP
jgi:hypothetical protein